MANPIGEGLPQVKADVAGPRMKAAICTGYGPPDVVQIRDVERPVPKDDEVLIKVRAASLNPADWHMKRGKPHIMRLMTGLHKPKDARLGFDVAGEIETVGRERNRVQARRRGLWLVPWGLCGICVCFGISSGQEARKRDV
jgi:NADPH:quinone reductase-like Zn-dependent oxidoreductase